MDADWKGILWDVACVVFIAVAVGLGLGAIALGLVAKYYGIA